jgi:hypothetical protein
LHLVCFHTSSAVLVIVVVGVGCVTVSTFSVVPVTINLAGSDRAGGWWWFCRGAAAAALGAPALLVNATPADLDVVAATALCPRVTAAV